MRPRDIGAFPRLTLLLLIVVSICISVSMQTKTEYSAMSYTCTNATHPFRGNTYAPRVPQPESGGDVVDFDLQNNQPSVLPAHYITFGEAFQEGKVPSGDRLQADINGAIIPSQLDVKTTYSDGSAEYGVVTLQQPSILNDTAVIYAGGIALGRHIIQRRFRPPERNETKIEKTRPSTETPKLPSDSTGTPGS